MSINLTELEAFCETHTCTEIINKYGRQGYILCLNNNFEHKDSRVKITDEWLDELREFCKTHYRQEVLNKYGNKIWYYLKKYNIRTCKKPYKITKIRNDEFSDEDVLDICIVSGYQNGLTIMQLAKAFQVSPKHINYLIHRCKKIEEYLYA